MLNKTISTIFDTIAPYYGSLSSRFLGGKALPPLIVQLDLTHRCNLNCKMCFQKSLRSGHEMPAELSFEEIKKIVDQLPPKSLVTLSGGEPLLRKDFLEICSYILDRHRCNIITNATLLTKDAIDLFIRKKLLLLGISIDGIGDTHDSIRGSKGAFEKTIRSLELIQEEKKKMKAGYPMIDIKTVILKENFNSLLELFDMCEKYKVNFFTLSMPFGYHNYFTESEKNTILDSIKRIRNRKSGVKVRVYPVGVENKQALFHLSDGKLTAENISPCKYPWMSMHIDPYGIVYPCQRFFEESIKENGYDPKRAWNSAKYRTFRESLIKNSIFPKCLESCCYYKIKK